MIYVPLVPFHYLPLKSHEITRNPMKSHEIPWYPMIYDIWFIQKSPEISCFPHGFPCELRLSWGPSSPCSSWGWSGGQRGEWRRKDVDLHDSDGLGCTGMAAQLGYNIYIWLTMIVYYIIYTIIYIYIHKHIYIYIQSWYIDIDYIAVFYSVCMYI